MRKGLPGDERDFAELVLVSAPYFPVLFGKRITTMLECLFQKPRNLFSYEHTCFAELNGETAGMILSYDWRAKEREDVWTGILFVRQMKLDFLAKLSVLLKFNTAVGGINEGECYISNVATFERYRGLGVGTALIAYVEEEAKKNGAVKMVLDVEKDNRTAIKFYERLGYKIIAESSVRLRKSEVIRSYRMAKTINFNGSFTQ